MKNDYDENAKEIKKSLEKILAPGQVAEVRAIGTIDESPKHPRVMHGYFDNIDEMAIAAADLTQHYCAVYFTPNPVNPELLERAKNKVQPAISGGSTADNDILKRNWLLIDLDPVRPANTSSSKEEHGLALKKARKIRDELTAEGWPTPITADSGNGAHLMYKVDLPCDDNGLVKRVLEALSQIYDDAKVKVDTGVFNPARIWKLYGTLARKGDDSLERPHRQAKILWDEPPDNLEFVPVEKLEELASIVKKEDKSFISTDSFDIEKWIETHRDKLDEYSLSGATEWLNGGKRWRFKVCPWNAEHTNSSAFIVQLPSGAVSAGCHHNSCQGKDWHALRDLMEPGWREKRKKYYKLTDYGNAERLVDLHGADLCYSFPRKKWYYWDEKRWVEDNTGEVFRRAKETVRRIYIEAAEIINDIKREATINWALRSESEIRIKAMIQLTESEPSIPITPEHFDSDPWLLNCLNGTLDLRTAELRPHERDDFITKIAPVEWKGMDENHPTWDKLLNDATDNDDELKEFLQRAGGYSLTGDISEEVLFFVHGPEASGKSTFVEALKATLGDYSTTADFEAFLKRQSVGNPRNDIARLAGSRFVASIEVDEGKRLAEGLIKMLTGGDKVSARFLYRESFEFLPSFKLWLAANHAPRVNADDGAMWRRILRVPFENVIPKDKRDPQIKKVLRDPEQAGSAILAWMVRGCLEWQSKGLGVPNSVIEATEEFRQDMDTLGDFFDDCCKIKTPKAVFWTSTADLMKAYQQWANKNAERYTVGRRTFIERLRSLGCTPVKKDEKRGWAGIELREEVKNRLDCMVF